MAVGGVHPTLAMQNELFSPSRLKLRSVGERTALRTQVQVDSRMPACVDTGIQL
jgi:hypothetical protein